MTEVTRYQISKLNGENYQVWKFKLLIKEGVWDVIETETADKANKELIKRDYEARASIGLLVDDSQLCLIRSAKTTMKSLLSRLKCQL